MSALERGTESGVLGVSASQVLIPGLRSAVRGCARSAAQVIMWGDGYTLRLLSRFPSLKSPVAGHFLSCSFCVFSEVPCRAAQNFLFSHTSFPGRDIR